jgi:aspartate/methionine/tyrosine aminotransferase
MEHNFTLNVDELESLITPRTRLLILNSPGNPTGGVIPKADVERIAELAERYDFWVMSDELYTRILYEGEVISIASLDGMKQRTIIVEGHSKTYAMTGWRLGYGAMPRGLAPWISRLATNCNSCTAAFTQIAGIEAYRGDQSVADEFVREFRRRRDIIVSGLNEIPGVKCLVPNGAFYVFPYVGEFGRTSKELEQFLLNEAGVAALTGTSFGAFGEGYIRFSYANSQENIKEALRRVSEGFAALKQ